MILSKLLVRSLLIRIRFPMDTQLSKSSICFWILLSLIYPNSSMKLCTNYILADTFYQKRNTVQFQTVYSSEDQTKLNKYFFSSGLISFEVCVSLNINERGKYITALYSREKLCFDSIFYFCDVFMRGNDSNGIIIFSGKI